MPGLYRILVVTVLKWQNAPLLNKKELEIQRMESLWRLSGTHLDIFLDFNVTVVFSNRLTL